MVTGALAGFGTSFKVGDGATPESFTTVAEVTDIKGPKLALNTYESTSHDSTDGWREYVPGLLEAGEVGIDLSFIPTNATQGYSTGLIKDQVNRTKRNFKVVFPDVGGTTWSFSGYVTGFEVNAPVDDLLTASVTIQITGKPTLA